MNIDKYYNTIQANLYTHPEIRNMVGNIYFGYPMYVRGAWAGATGKGFIGKLFSLMGSRFK